jgi:hypothetical protein
MPANLTQDDLWSALDTLGTDGDIASIRPDVIDNLIELIIAEHGANGPQLTPYGEKAFVALESGDGSVPELNDFPPAGE